MLTRSVIEILYFFLPAYLANMSPVLVRRWFCAFALPIDGGRTLWGKRILGGHKTSRGLLAGIVTGIVAYEIQQFVYGTGAATELALSDYAAYPIVPELLMGLGPGIGDSVKSFFKRRIDIEPGARLAGVRSTRLLYRRVPVRFPRLRATVLGYLGNPADHPHHRLSKRDPGLLARI